MDKVNVVLQGFTRVQIKENGELKGDSGWIKNRFTDYGLDEGFARHLITQANAVTVDYAAVGTGAAPATNETALAGEITHNTNSRDQTSKSIVTAADASGVTLRHYGTFVSSALLSTTAAIQNIGLFASSQTQVGSVVTGTSYTVSTIQSNQDLEYTYEWQISTS